MVFTTVANLTRVRGPDKFWKRHQFFKYAAHFQSRKRNCFSLTIRAVYRSLQYAARGRKEKKADRRELWVTRLQGACMELNHQYDSVISGLNQCNVSLNHKILSELSVYEPRTFKCLTDLGVAALQVDPPYENHDVIHKPKPESVYTRGLKYEVD